MPIVNREIDWEGALVDALIGVPAPRRAHLVRLNMPVPTAVPVAAQIDTGAHRTGIDYRILRSLGLDGEVDVEEVLTSSTADVPHQSPVYLVDLTLVGGDGNRSFGTMRVLAHTFGDHERTRAIIGRDLLASCLLEYDGGRKQFRLSF